MSDENIRVAVVGAGIAGLTLAAALSRAGIGCAVYEQAQQLREVGAGIQLSPNATRLLGRLGLTDHLETVGVPPAAIEMHRWDTDAVLMRTTLGAECEQMYGAPYYCVHRADLHRGLYSLVPDGTVHLGHRCVRIEQHADGVTLRFENGSTATADVVVGADGIHSVVRSALVTDQPRFSGQAVYRGLVPAQRLAQLTVDPKVVIWLGPGQHTVCYPVAGGRLVSFVATTPATDPGAESWTVPGRVEDLLAAYQGWHPQVLTVLAAADTVTRWALYDRDLVGRWSGERITLIGDAAHPMLPFGAQGANQAIEDAMALAVCLRTRYHAGTALKHYEEVRRPRTELVHQKMRENARNHHYSDGDQQRQRDETMSDNWGLRGQAWLYGYDAEQAVGF
jgi:salicylate hydroxylase